MSPQVQESPSGSVASSGHERTTLVLGVNGQDGSYLAETLLAKGYRVVGVGRQQESRWVDPERDNFEYVECDLMDLDAFEVVLRSVVPHFAFHFAAVHGSSGFPYEDVWKAAHVVNTLSLHALAGVHPNGGDRVPYRLCQFGQSLRFPSCRRHQ